MDNYENFALGCFLCEWPEDKTFDEIIDMMENDNDEENGISVWEPFEYHEQEWVAGQIISMEKSVRERFVPRETPA